MRELFRMDRQNYNPDGKVYTRPSARAIIVKDGKVLLNYIAKHECYEFPGGGIEAGETPEQAMIREVAEETGHVVIPETIREFGSIFEQRNYYYSCEVTDEIVPRKPDEHEVKEGAEPVWVEMLAIPIHRTKKAFRRVGEAFMERESRVMEIADAELRRRSYEKTEENAIAALGDADYKGMLQFVKDTLRPNSAIRASSIRNACSAGQSGCTTPPQIRTDFAMRT